jgi:uncharacterized protein DUF3576
MLGGITNKVALLLVSVIIAGCGALNSGGSGNSSAGSSAGGLFGGKIKGDTSEGVPRNNKERGQSPGAPLDLNELLNPANDNADIRVNKYLWQSSLDTLSFLPIEAADPFSGVIVLGWGRAPGSNTDFRATILIQDPALEAASLKVAMQRRNGPASAETNRRIEDAILTRARQLRIKGAKRR